MAQSFTTKQAAFVNRYSGAVQALLNTVDALTLMNTEFTNNFYGTGGANAITDVVVQGVLPAATAAQFNSAEAAVVAILNTVATNRGTLETMRI